ncbi:hypothetical protein WN51_11835 [Melipona quadrifasciata]|uniref:Uncharacterized protein n=1 Tax=Melipona quadrifasciata TaxID=166423 RepID=A0A0M9A2T8_9HYME|nr:hypothetical protein WN51_11835 [Melipona quadrifasciata]
MAKTYAEINVTFPSTKKEDGGSANYTNIVRIKVKEHQIYTTIGTSIKEVHLILALKGFSDDLMITKELLLVGTEIYYLVLTRTGIIYVDISSFHRQPIFMQSPIFVNCAAWSIENYIAYFVLNISHPSEYVKRLMKDFTINVFLNKLITLRKSNILSERGAVVRCDMPFSSFSYIGVTVDCLGRLGKFVLRAPTRLQSVLDKLLFQRYFLRVFVSSKLPHDFTKCDLTEKFAPRASIHGRENFHVEQIAETEDSKLSVARTTQSIIFVAQKLKCARITRVSNNTLLQIYKLRYNILVELNFNVVTAMCTEDGGKFAISFCQPFLGKGMSSFFNFLGEGSREASMRSKEKRECCENRLEVERDCSKTETTQRAQSAGIELFTPRDNEKSDEKESRRKKGRRSVNFQEDQDRRKTFARKCGTLVNFRELFKQLDVIDSPSPTQSRRQSTLHRARQFKVDKDFIRQTNIRNRQVLRSAEDQSVTSTNTTLLFYKYILFSEERRIFLSVLLRMNVAGIPELWASGNEVQSFVIRMDGQPGFPIGGETGAGGVVPLVGRSLGISGSQVVPGGAGVAASRINRLGVCEVPVLHSDLVAVVNDRYARQSHRQHGDLVGSTSTEPRGDAMVVVIAHHPVGHLAVRHGPHPSVDQSFKVHRVGAVV